MAYEEALIHLEMGRHITGPEGKRHLEQARNTFMTIGATNDATRAAEPLSKT